MKSIGSHLGIQICILSYIENAELYIFLKLYLGMRRKKTLGDVKVVVVGAPGVGKSGK